MMFDVKEHSHTRLNILTGDWVLVSPHRMKSPWQGRVEDLPNDKRPEYDPACYLCPGNMRADGSVNPDYTEPYAFVNDFSALLKDTPEGGCNEGGLLQAKIESGVCKVLCFSPRHDLTLPQMTTEAIEKVIDLWQREFTELATLPEIRYIQIFENKGEIMGCSNPHPEWHWHMHFYPPLLRSATVKKFMVGYEMLANPQRDITPESADEKLKALPIVHYSEA
jgi:UDPglucose--hexose-1-phosphate uridylyltransferase